MLFNLLLLIFVYCYSEKSWLLSIHSSGQTISSLAHIEGITLGAGEEVDEVAGGASGMGVDGIGDPG